MKATTDLWFASFLIQAGYKLASFKKLTSRRCEYQFDIGTDDWSELKLRFVNSNVSKLKQIQQELRDLLY